MNRHPDRTLPWRLLAAAALLAAALGAAAAPPPIELEADRVEVDDNRGVSVYEGAVVVTQGRRVVRADRVVVRNDAQGPARLEAEGAPATLEDVDAEGRPLRGEGRRIDYDLRGEVVVITGEARLRQGGDRFRGEHIEYRIADGRIRAEGGDARVHILLAPREGATGDGR
ncbi:lipopolysaccharide transport periplasmic protein LptA [Inmirania thermothiophila]|uniref:Lipopolysaccharide export system protein LptA n=1 Tax=Inmirania thermothiophila TaxID=1750597 RepID=A0A3N1XSY9_9GAMM|nr:lipopolysaccharide transport periplasmic protein LptA [Inmirania thermothiophila]ROR29760.1 lipopolysaccharide export system protein LptA [Inmirania thermothiophila]